MKLFNAAAVAAVATLSDDLQAEVRRSLLVPQYGPYHNEGPFMGSHLELVFRALLDAAQGVFHPDVPEAVRPAMDRLPQARHP